jgi:hypothetical protein
MECCEVGFYEQYNACTCCISHLALHEKLISRHDPARSLMLPTSVPVSLEEPASAMMHENTEPFT